MEWLTHDNAEEEDRRFAHILADALWRTQTVPDRELCERWLREGFVDENELEMVLEAYEAIWQGGQ